jgi:hypothetical protein
VFNHHAGCYALAIKEKEEKNSPFAAREREREGGRDRESGLSLSHFPASSFSFRSYFTNKKTPQTKKSFLHHELNL